MGYRTLNNPYACKKCATRADACCCCDTGFDIAFFEVRITGCARLTTTTLVTIHRKCAPEDLGTGISYPDNDPCCVFSGDLGLGDTGCTSGGVAYTGAVRLILWCDTNLPCTQPYRIRVYCQKTDLSWELQGEAAITLYECRCQGPYIEFTLPDLNCCCEAPPPITCGDCSIPQTLTATFTGCGGGSYTITYDSMLGAWVGTGPDCGTAYIVIQMTCTVEDGVVVTLETVPPSGSEFAAASYSCSPFDATAVIDGTTLTCCGGSVTVEITE